ncbi:hypothetical protein [Nocardia brasiliensis]|uniref:hypothetical protein n=1 Tax=Nocardia brasiliensis TaxID=37326 RepID=UPI002456305A|nr:hypothetical protein [Nocardia brasiliensis]
MAIPDEVLTWLEEISAQCDPPPWTAMVEGRDMLGGDSFIQVGADTARGEDIYLTRDSGPANAAYLDLVAAARTYLPALVSEVRTLRARLDGES